MAVPGEKLLKDIYIDFLASYLDYNVQWHRIIMIYFTTGNL